MAKHSRPRKFGDGTWCERHWQPYRERRGNGVQAAILLTQALVNDEAFMRRCGWNPDTGARADTDRMNAEMEKLKPICDYLGDAKMDEIFEACKWTADRPDPKDSDATD